MFLLLPEGESLPEPPKPQLLQIGRPFLRESSPFVSLHLWWFPSSHFHGISLVPAGDALSSLCSETWQGSVEVVLQCPIMVQMQESKPPARNDPRNAPLCSQRDIEDTCIMENDILFSKQSLLASLELDTALRLCSDTKVFRDSRNLVG